MKYDKKIAYTLGCVITAIIALLGITLSTLFVMFIFWETDFTKLPWIARLIDVILSFFSISFASSYYDKIKDSVNKID